MIYFKSAPTYAVVFTDVSGCNAPQICSNLEKERNDGYAVTAWQDGKIVADAEGWVEKTSGSDPFDLACERRFD